MARVTISDIDEGDTLNIESVNDSIDSWNSVSKQINGDNVRVQGLDQRLFRPVIRSPPTSYQGGTSSLEAHGPTASWSPVKPGGNWAMVQPYWNAGDGDRILLKASLQFYMTPRLVWSVGTGHIPWVRFRLEVAHPNDKNNSTGWYEVPTTERQFSFDHMYAGKADTSTTHHYGFDPHTPLDATCTIVTLIDTDKLTQGSNTPVFRIVYRATQQDGVVYTGVAASGTDVHPDTTLYPRAEIEDTPSVYIGFTDFSATTYRR